MRCSRGSPGMPLKSVTTKVLDRHCPPYLSTRNGGSGELNVLGLDNGNSSKQIHIRRTVISRNLGQNPYFTELNAWRDWPSVDEEQFLREKTGGPLWARGRPRESSRSLFQGVGSQAPVSPASGSPSDFPSDWLGSRAAVSPAPALAGRSGRSMATRSAGRSWAANLTLGGKLPGTCVVSSAENGYGLRFYCSPT